MPLIEHWKPRDVNVVGIYTYYANAYQAWTRHSVLPEASVRVARKRSRSGSSWKISSRPSPR